MQSVQILRFGMDISENPTNTDLHDALLQLNATVASVVVLSNLSPAIAQLLNYGTDGK